MLDFIRCFLQPNPDQQDRGPSLTRGSTPSTFSTDVNRHYHRIPQRQSLFFAKLPVELRNQVYKELFDYRKIHLEWDEQSRRPWSQVGCDALPEETLEFWRNDNCLLKHGKKLLRLELAISYTCRQAYDEWITMLYSTTIFDFVSKNALYHFCSITPPQQYGIITTMELGWSCRYEGQPHLMPGSKQAYDDLWAFIATLSSLLVLKFSIHGPRRPYSVSSLEGDAISDAWLRPLNRIARDQLHVFDVAVPEKYFVLLKKPEGALYRLIEISEECD